MIYVRVRKEYRNQVVIKSNDFWSSSLSLGTCQTFAQLWHLMTLCRHQSTFVKGFDSDEQMIGLNA